MRLGYIDIMPLFSRLCLGSIAFLFGVGGYSGHCRAQVANRAIQFDGAQSLAQITRPTKFFGRDSFSIELWVKIDAWDDGASLFAIRAAKDQELRLQLAADRGLRILFRDGPLAECTFNSALEDKCWQHLAIVFNGKRAPKDRLEVYVNRVKKNVNSFRGELPHRVFSTPACFVLGAGLHGQIDELRLWSTAVTRSQILDYNTISPSHPRHDELLGYWKFDHPADATVYDFKSEQHGRLIGGASKSIVADNQRFRYRSLQNYFPVVWLARGDRPSVEYLTNCNELTVMLMHIGAGGETHFAHPDNDAVFSNAERVDSYRGRNGVAVIQRDGYLNCGKYAWTNGDRTVLLSGWFHLNQWTEGGSLFSMGPNLSLSLGDVQHQELVLRYNNVRATAASRLLPGEWHYVTVVFDGSQSPADRLQMFLDAKPLAMQVDDAASVNEVLDFGAGHDLIVGQNLSCAVDGLFAQSRMGVDAGSIRWIMQNGFTDVLEWSDWYVKMFLDFGDSRHPGRDSRKSSEDFRRYILDKIEGYDGVRLTLGLGTGGDWKAMVADPKARRRSVKSVQQALLDYPRFWGVDIDFEWPISDQEIADFEAYATELHAAVSTMNPPRHIVTSGSVAGDEYVRFVKESAELRHLTHTFSVQSYRIGWTGYQADAEEWARAAEMLHNDCKVPCGKISLGIMPTSLFFFPESRKRFEHHGLAYKHFHQNYPSLTLDPDRGKLQLEDVKVKGTVYPALLYEYDTPAKMASRCRVVIEKDLRGCMIFSGCVDFPYDHPFCLQRLMNAHISANVHKLIDKNLNLDDELGAVASDR